MAYTWYWLDDLGQWIEYGKENPIHPQAKVNSADLEKAFLADQRGTLVFMAGSQIYELDFKDMVQRNLIYATQRKVMRLPKNSYSQREQDKSLYTEPSSSLYPPEWDQSALPEIGYKLVDVGSTSSEYRRIESLFQKTMKDYNICRLQRIQNPTLWQIFQWQKEQMKKLHKSNRVDERLLFHGTDPCHVPSICEQNFDWRICGTHGTMYGKVCPSCWVCPHPVPILLLMSSSRPRGKNPCLIALDFGQKNQGYGSYYFRIIVCNLQFTSFLGVVQPPGVV
ncbi:protein mono-ADP-ribosyltransferase PARP12-like isoform X2 [Coturnix japonica]|uniref:protein mono-ADP-ribosyltransferase PARP12-like isoform X2 n=1 Tax=Coturnix japonica TaxID=93934 RepID=UPI0013A5D43E|nr:protein mono-ADP-ribosyltransferase PARP12-like isoform X2 [Coturnix japonica]